MRPENSSNYLIPYDEQIANRAKKIRCRRCGHRTLDGLTICPNCGRTLSAAFSRWITWGIPIALAALLLLSIWGASGQSPLTWAATISQGLGNLAASVGAQIEPRVTAPESVFTPMAPTQNQASPAVDTASSVPVLTPISVQEPVAEPDNVSTLQTGDAAIDQPAAASNNVVIPSESANLAAEVPASNQIEGDAENDGLTVASTAAVVPTSTPLTLAQTNRSTSATPNPTQTNRPTRVPSTTVKATDTAVPTDTSAPATPEPQPAYRANAVELQLPKPGAELDCSKDNLVSWQAPLSMVATDRFLLNLGYISGQNENQYIVTWVVKQKFSIDRTSWVLDPAYCKLSSIEFNNQWVWYVQVIDENDKAVSEPSRTSYFVWQKPL